MQRELHDASYSAMAALNRARHSADAATNGRRTLVVHATLELERSLDRRRACLGEHRLVHGEHRDVLVAASSPAAGEGVVDQVTDLFGVHVAGHADHARGAHAHHRHRQRVVTRQDRDGRFAEPNQLLAVQHVAGRVLETDDVGARVQARAACCPRSGRPRCGPGCCTARSARATLSRSRTMLNRPFLRRLAVVGHHDHHRVGARFDRCLGGVDALLGGVRAGPSDHDGALPFATRLLRLMSSRCSRVRQRGRLARRATRHEASDARRHLRLDVLLECREVHLHTVRRKRGHERGVSAEKG